MTSSLAIETLAAAAPIAFAYQLTEQHLDVLQMHPGADIQTRLMIGAAVEAVRAGATSHPAVVYCAKAYNKLCGRR